MIRLEERAKLLATRASFDPLATARITNDILTGAKYNPSLNGQVKCGLLLVIPITNTDYYDTWYRYGLQQLYL